MWVSVDILDENVEEVGDVGFGKAFDGTGGGAELDEPAECVRMGNEGKVGIGGGTGRWRLFFGLTSVGLPLPPPPPSLSLPRSRSPSPSLSRALLLPGLLLFDLLLSLASLYSANFDNASLRSESFVDTTVSSRGSRSTEKVP